MPSRTLLLLSVLLTGCTFNPAGASPTAPESAGSTSPLSNASGTNPDSSAPELRGAPPVMASPSPAVGPLTAQEIAKRAFSSTMMLVMMDAQGQEISIGSGFVVRDGVVATNRHVIEGGYRGYVRKLGETAVYEIAGVVGDDEAHDVALVSVPDLKAPSLPLGDSEQVGIGDEIYAIGNPKGLEGTFSEGIVSSVRLVSIGKVIQITAPISPGSSGGPIMNNRGEVIGVATFKYLEGESLNFAFPSRYVETLIAGMTPAIPLSKFNAAALTVNAPSAPPPAASTELTAFRAAQFSFQYPAAWQSRPATMDTGVAYITATEGYGDFFVQAIPAKLPLAEYQRMEEEYAGAGWRRTDAAQIGGIGGFRVVSTTHIDNYPVTQMTFGIIHAGTVFRIVGVFDEREAASKSVLAGYETITDTWLWH